MSTVISLLDITSQLSRNVARLSKYFQPLSENERLISTRFLNDSMRVFSPVIYFSECGTEREYTVPDISKGRDPNARVREKRTDAKRRKKGEKKGEESKGEEHSSCVYRMRVEFYACLIWKWIAREYASMRRVEEGEKGDAKETEKGEERGRERERNRWNRLFRRRLSLSLPFICPSPCFSFPSCSPFCQVS